MIEFSSVEYLIDTKSSRFMWIPEGVDQAGLAELASERLIVEQNVVYHLPKGGALVVSIDAQGYRGAAAMNLDEALEQPSLVCCKISKGHGNARRDGDEVVACQSDLMVIEEEAVFLGEMGTARRAPCYDIDMPGLIRLNESEELTSVDRKVQNQLSGRYTASTRWRCRSIA